MSISFFFREIIFTEHFYVFKKNEQKLGSATSFPFIRRKEKGERIRDRKLHYLNQAPWTQEKI